MSWMCNTNSNFCVPVGPNDHPHTLYTSGQDCESHSGGCRYVPDMLVCSQTKAGCEPYNPFGPNTGSPMIVSKDQCASFCQAGSGTMQFQYICRGILGHDDGSNYCASVPPTHGPVGPAANRFNSLRGCEQTCYSSPEPSPPSPSPPPPPPPSPTASTNFKCVQDYESSYCLSGAFPSSGAGVYSSIGECLATCQ